ncbi:MAG: Fe-S protein assembly co-chaperone HscB [Pseudomonadota bacterium]
MLSTQLSGCDERQQSANGTKTTQMDFNTDHFTLLGLAQSFQLDRQSLDQHYRELQSAMHPDKFVNASDTERRLSMQWATQINAAYQTLKNPRARAQYLLQLRGIKVDAENNNAMSNEFLLEQMEWRESVSTARSLGAEASLLALQAQLAEQSKDYYEALTQLLDQSREWQAAADLVCRLMFIEKLATEIEQALDEVNNDPLAHSASH